MKALVPGELPDLATILTHVELMGGAVAGHAQKEQDPERREKLVRLAAKLRTCVSDIGDL